MVWSEFSFLTEAEGSIIIIIIIIRTAVRTNISCSGYKLKEVKQKEKKERDVTRQNIEVFWLISSLHTYHLSIAWL